MDVFDGSAAYPAPSPGPIVTVGNFDGVHLGHRALIDRARAVAREQGRPLCVYTFWPPPVAVLRPELKPLQIQSKDERLASLAQAGVDQVVVERFDAEFSKHDAAWFADEVMGRRLGAAGMVVGWDFKFGRGRAGHADLLRERLGIPVEPFGPWTLDGEVVSSSRVRELVQQGDVGGAARLLGRPHTVSGEVVKGDGRGRTIGIPTANLRVTTELLPADGVYAVRMLVGGQRVPGVANVGVRPTFAAGRSFEVHLLDFDADLYGRTVAVELIERIRGERKFSGIQELVARIHADIAEARSKL